MQTNGFFFPGFPKYLLSLLPVAKTANDCAWLVFIGTASFLALLVLLDTMGSLNVDLQVKLDLDGVFNLRLNFFPRLLFRFGDPFNANVVSPRLVFQILRFELLFRQI